MDGTFDNLKLRAYHMPRPRLDEVLDRASHCKLAYVIAGAGYGKTQAVRHYITQQTDAVVRWIQLSEGDNVGSRYWKSFTQAVSIDNPDLAAQLYEFGFPETLARFKQFAEILRQSEHHAHKAFLVLDDFHVIHSKEILTFVRRYVHLQLPGVCVMLLSRQEPALNIASLRSRGKVCTISEETLRFTIHEAAAFFQQQNIPITSQHLPQLMDASKGWAFAINIASVLLQRVPYNFNYALNAMQQNIFQLLETEAWDNLSEQVKKTMVKLSLLSNLPSMSLQEVLGNANLLQDIPGLASFIWVHTFTHDLNIHPLYLEFLQNKQNMLSDAEKQEVYCLAADWCSEHGFFIDAMYYYAKSRQFERMIKTLLSYPLKLPRDTSEYFLEIFQNLDISQEEQQEPNVAFLTNYFIPLFLIGADRFEEAQTASFAVLQNWAHMDDPLAASLRSATYSNLAYIDMFYCTVSHRYDAPEYVKQSVEHLERVSLPPAEASVSFISADIRSFACLVGAGADLSEFDQFIEAARQTDLYIAQTPYSIYAGYADLAACEYAYFKNQPDIARSYAHKAISKAREKKQYSIEATAESYLLRIAMQEGDTTYVKILLKQLRAHLDNADFWNRRLYYDLYTGLFYIQIGQLDLVPYWFVMDDRETLYELSIPVRELIVSVQYNIAAEKYHQALTVLANSSPRAPQHRFQLGELRLSLLSAVAHLQTGDTAAAIAAFKQAYALSFQGVLEMPFIELGTKLHPLVTALLKQADSDIPPEWCKAIDRKASVYAKKLAVIANAVQTEAGSRDTVSLSKRERELLTDLYHGLSREEIAANRYLSINTVKKTLQSAYIKLDAHNNVEAVRIALEKKLIE